MTACFILLASFSCGDSDKKPSADEPPPPDLTERLSDEEARAGVVTDETALFGGISAEGRAGDVKLYNNRVQFVIQAPGDSSYYVGYGGSVIDADIIRPDGQPGQDMIDDGCMMVGLGRMFNGETVTVINDGQNGEAAVVRATGGVDALTILTGTLEADSLIQDRDVDITIDYILEPNSHLLRIESTVKWMDEQTPIQLADMIFYSGEVASRYQDTVGRDGATPETYQWTAAVGDRNEGALLILQGEERDTFEANGVLETVGDFGPLLLGSNPTTDLNNGDVVKWTRYWGVGADIAEVLEDWHAERGATTEAINGTVSAGGSPLAGANVHVLDGMGRPVTMAVTDEDGRFEATVAAGTAASAIAESRGPAVYFDTMPGAGWYTPYAAENVRNHILRTTIEGALPIAFSPGHGLSTAMEIGPTMAFDLIQPGELDIRVQDNGPAVVRVSFASSDDIEAPVSVAPYRPRGDAAWAYVSDGQMQIPLEPGTYTAVVHRGTTHEAVTTEIEIVSGETTRIEANLTQSVDTTGYRSIDPHSHAAPSGDGQIPMEGRLIVSAAHGVDIHVGTDHDHVADYRVLLEPLGLTQHLASIVADEVSPTLRGHHNAYPLEGEVDSTNGGAFRWWNNWREWATTEGFHEWIHGMKSDGPIIVQANHPTGSAGLFGNAGYNLETGTIAKASHWSTNFDAVEVLNDGGYNRVFPYYIDLLNRGLNPTPVGVSDSHDHYEGMGVNRTWIPMDVASAADVTNNDVRAGMIGGGSVASFGPMLVPTVAGAWAPGQTYVGPTDLDVAVRTPSWMVVDTVHVFQNGTEIETIALEENTASVRLAPESDAVYVITVSSSTDMAPVYPGKRPWALAQGIFVDVEGDGWTPPLPPLTVD